jgi:hypothetical protein
MSSNLKYKLKGKTGQFNGMEQFSLYDVPDRTYVLNVKGMACVSKSIGELYIRGLLPRTGK